MVRDDRLWETFCAVIDRPELLIDERFAEPRVQQMFPGWWQTALD